MQPMTPNLLLLNQNFFPFYNTIICMIWHLIQILQHLLGIVIVIIVVLITSGPTIHYYAILYHILLIILALVPVVTTTFSFLHENSYMLLQANEELLLKLEEKYSNTKI